MRRVMSQHQFVTGVGMCAKRSVQPFDFDSSLAAERRTGSIHKYQQQVAKNAKALAAAITKHGLRVVSGGTDNHLVLVEVHSRGITGNDAEKALDRAGITVNKNSIPFDPLPPMKAGGIRLGTPSITTRGMEEPEMDLIAGWIADVLAQPGNAETEQRVRKQVAELAANFPIYEDRVKGPAHTDHARMH
jgi:glycine hydroxymethyltransferase